MNYTREDLLLITACAAMPGAPWRELERATGMGATKAAATRDRLTRARVLVLDRVTLPDARGRLYRRTRYVLRADLPSLDEIRAWVASDRKVPPPIPMPDARTRTPASKPPGVARDPADRLLETILRNPRAPWRLVRDACGLRSDAALRFRDELEQKNRVRADVHEAQSRNGRRYVYRILVPNEDDPHVQEMRKRYRIPAIASIDPVLARILEEPPQPSALPVVDTHPVAWLKRRG